MEKRKKFANCVNRDIEHSCVNSHAKLGKLMVPSV